MEMKMLFILCKVKIVINQRFSFTLLLKCFGVDGNETNEKKTVKREDSPLCCKLNLSEQTMFSLFGKLNVQ